MQHCQAERIKFLQLKYRIHPTATTRKERRGVYQQNIYESHLTTKCHGRPTL